MKKLAILMCCAVFLQILLGCGAAKDDYKEPVNFYYEKTNVSYNSSSGVIEKETREGSVFQGNLTAFLHAYLRGPESDILQSIIPSDVYLVSCEIIGNTAYITLSSQFANCCCENRLGIADLKYTVATENCADRTAAYQNTRDIIDSQTRGTQAILDKLCQLELDAKNDKINDLERQLTMANLNASQTAQNAFIAQGFANEVDQLYDRLSNCPVPSMPVYGRTPIFTCPSQNNGCGCGCNGGF